MGKATRWLKGLFGKKKEKEHFENSSPLALDKERKRWSFTRSCKEVTHIRSTLDNDWFRYCFSEKENEQNKHCIAVAAADATVAAAQAAGTVVRVRSHGSDTLFSGGVNWWAALKIQSFFRGYLARKALRALKGLVKIQALVRGYLVRKRAAATLYSMQALMRAQVAITSQRAHRYTSMKRLQPEIRAKIYMQRYDGIRSEFQSKRLARSCDTSLNGFDESPKSVEIDNHVPHQLRPSRYTTTAMSECRKEFCSPCRAPRRKSVPECRPRQDCELYFDEECKFSTASSTPRLANYCKLHNAPPTPVKSVCGETLLSSCPDSPNYMANTQSSKAKLRSHSAPRQRPDHKKRFSVSETMAARNSTTGVRMQSSPQTVEYSILNKIVQEYYVNWEGQSKI